MAADDTWDRCLDALEAQLDLLDRQTGGDPTATDPDDAWVEPQGLGPMPVRCRERAELLLDRLRHVAEEIEAARGALVGDLGRERTRRDAVRSYAATGTA